MKTKRSNYRFIFIIMMTSSNGNIFRVTGPLCGEFTGPGEFPAQRPVTRSFDVFFDLRPNKRLSKQPWGWWFETSSWSLWRQCNDGNPYTGKTAYLTWGGMWRPQSLPAVTQYFNQNFTHHPFLLENEDIYYLRQSCPRYLITSTLGNTYLHEWTVFFFIGSGNSVYHRLAPAQ